MSIKKYHKEVFFDKGLILSCFTSLSTKTLRYSRHAQLETIKDRYQTVPVITSKSLKFDDIFEYVVDNGIITKLVFRISTLSDTHDFSYSISTDGAVVTCWGNAKDDIHKTLNHSLYERAN